MEKRVVVGRGRRRHLLLRRTTTPKPKTLNTNSLCFLPRIMNSASIFSKSPPSDQIETQIIATTLNHKNQTHNIKPCSIPILNTNQKPISQNHRKNETLKMKLNLIHQGFQEINMGLSMNTTQQILR